MQTAIKREQVHFCKTNWKPRLVHNHGWVVTVTKKNFCVTSDCYINIVQEKTILMILEWQVPKNFVIKTKPRLVHGPGRKGCNSNKTFFRCNVVLLHKISMLCYMILGHFLLSIIMPSQSFFLVGTSKEF